MRSFIAALAFWLLFPGSVFGQRISIVVVDSDYDYPAGRIPVLTLFPDGKLGGLDTVILDDKSLTQVLSQNRVIDNKKLAYVRIVASSEKDVSVELLSSLLRRINRLSPADTEIKVFVCLRESLKNK